MTKFEQMQIRQMHTPEVPLVAEIVKASLKDGPTTANAIKHKTGLRHEDVYQALVWLEARGKAFLRSHFESKGNTVTQWSGA